MDYPQPQRRDELVVEQIAVCDDLVEADNLLAPVSISDDLRFFPHANRALEKLGCFRRRHLRLGKTLSHAGPTHTS